MPNEHVDYTGNALRPRTIPTVTLTIQDGETIPISFREIKGRIDRTLI